MTKQEFFDSLIWIEGMPPALQFHDGSFYETALAENCPPMAVKTKAGDLMIDRNPPQTTGLLAPVDKAGFSDVSTIAP